MPLRKNHNNGTKDIKQKKKKKCTRQQNLQRK